MKLRICFFSLPLWRVARYAAIVASQDTGFWHLFISLDRIGSILCNFYRLQQILWQWRFLLSFFFLLLLFFIYSVD